MLIIIQKDYFKTKYEILSRSNEISVSRGTFSIVSLSAEVIHIIELSMFLRRSSSGNRLILQTLAFRKSICIDLGCPRCYASQVVFHSLFFFEKNAFADDEITDSIFLGKRNGEGRSMLQKLINSGSFTDEGFLI